MRRYPWLLSILLVYPDGSGLYPNIQSAVDAAVAGDEVVLADGFFEGPGNWDIDLRGKAITVRAQTRRHASLWMLDVFGDHRAFTMNSGEAPDTVIHGIGMVHGALEGVVRIENSSPTLMECGISDGMGPAIYSVNSHPTFSECYISGFDTKGAGHPAIYSVGGYLTMKDSNIVYMGSGDGEAESVVTGGLFQNVVFWFNTYEGYNLRVEGPQTEGCVTLVNTVCQALQVIPPACVRIRNSKTAEVGGYLPLALEDKSWGEIKERYR
jgi:hypothetical protein